MTAPQILMLPNLNNAGQRTPPIATGFDLIRFCKLISGSEPVLCITNCVTRAEAAATVASTRRSGTLAQRLARERLAPNCFICRQTTF